jgi:hypothetical protein
MATATNTKRAKVELEAAFVNYGYGHCRTTTFVDDVAGSLTDEYFDLNVLDFDGNETQYYVLLDGSTPAVDPAPAGKTQILLDYTDGDSKETLAGLYVTALASIGVFSKDNGDGTVTVENWYAGPITNEDFSNAPSLTETVEREGLGGNLGATNEGIEAAFNISSVVLNGNQFGEIKIGESFTGSALEVTAAFLEVDPDLKETLFSAIGDTVVSGSDKFSGFGESKLFKNLEDFSGRLILHPIRLDATDRSEDLCLWKAVVKPESINFDGTSQRAMSCTFSSFLDASKKSSINLGGFGDWTKSDLDA